ncbi:redoxin domain-containing protein [Rhodoflexus sp.]
MKKLFSTLWVALLVVSAAQAQYERLKVQPAQIKQGDIVKITYSAAGGPIKTATQLFVTAYAIAADETNERIQIEMKETNGVWEGSFTPPANAVGIFWDVRTADNADNNGGEGYYSLIADKNGALLPHAQGAMGVFYEMTGVGLIGDRNEALANQLFEREMQSFPANKSPYLFHLVGNLISSNKKDAAEKYMADFNNLIKQTASFRIEREFIMAQRIAQMLERKEDAERLAAEGLQRFPTGEVAKMNLFTAFRSATDLEKKLAILKEFREKIGIDERLFPNMTMMVVQEYVNQSQWQEGLQLVKSIPLENNTVSIYNSTAQILAQPKNAQYDLALPLVQSVIAFADEQVKSAIAAAKPDMSMTTALANAKGIAGGIFMQQNKPAEALPLLEAALPAERMMGGSLLENYAKALAAAGEPAKALETVSKMVRENKGNDAIKASLKNIYAKAKGSETGWEDYLKGLEAEAQKKMVAEIAAKMIDEPAPNFKLTNLAGETVSLEGLRGKVVVIDFWATWCGPCIASFPGMKKAQDSFKGRDDVQFLFINSWERVEDKKKQAEEFITKKAYDFNVPMDEDNSVIGSYKVSGIPTKFVIDKQGRIRFKSVGYNGSTDLTAQEMQIMISLLAEM